MALYSKNPSPWRVSATGPLPAHNYSGEPTAIPCAGDTRLDKVTAKTGTRRKRFKRETVNRHNRKRAARRHGKASS
jgi:hypothetical protein